MQPVMAAAFASSARKSHKENANSSVVSSVLSRPLDIIAYFHHGRIQLDTPLPDFMRTLGSEINTGQPMGCYG